MRVLILGCGYVGLELGAELARQGHEVVGVRRSPPAGQMEAAGIQPVAADITRAEDLAGIPGPFDWVVNCVAAGGGTGEHYRRIYLDGMRTVVEWLQTKPIKKFVYTSSTSVYAQNDGSVVTESSPTEPDAKTARILLETEQVLLEAARHGRIPAVILRVAGIYGPGRGYWFKQFVSGEARMEGAGDRILNMIHRDDVAGAIAAALKNGRTGQIYNAVDDEPVSQREFFAWLAEQLNRPLPSSIAPQTTRKRGSGSKRVSNEKLTTELGFAFKFRTFREGFAEEVRIALAPRQT